MTGNASSVFERESHVSCKTEVDFTTTFGGEKDGS